MIEIEQAIASLVNTPISYYVEDGVLTGWDISEEKTGIPQPTDSEITAELNRLQAEFDSQQYARDRASAYPSLTDQADMAYWDRKNGTTTLDDAITAVKSAYPKT
jgi:hypothetical protein